jgi:hypothetical protein
MAGSDGTRTSIDIPPMSQTKEVDINELVPEEQTMQGSSYLIERITPIRAGGQPIGEPTGLVEEHTAPPNAPTAVVPAVSVHPSLASPGAAMMQTVVAPQKAQGARDLPTAALPAVGRGALLESETAYVPLPGSAPPPGMTPGAPAPAAQPAAPAGPSLKQKIHRATLQIRGKIEGSKNARLGLIAAGGLLALGLTYVAFSPRQRVVSPPVVQEQAPEQRAEQAEHSPRQAPLPSDERDQILEKAILAVEAGRIDEALALFRRYAEEDNDPSVSVMIQLLQAQVSAGTGER